MAAHDPATMTASRNAEALSLGGGHSLQLKATRSALTWRLGS